MVLQFSCYVCMVSCDVKLSYLHVTMLTTIDHILGHIGRTRAGPLFPAGGGGWTFHENINDMDGSLRKHYTKNITVLPFSLIYEKFIEKINILENELMYLY